MGAQRDARHEADDDDSIVYRWQDVVRRARLDRTTKYVALLAASYANPDGTNVYPGVARLAVESTLSVASVRRALAKLRSVGLLEVAKPGNRRRGEADEYRLIFADDLLDRLDVPDPDVHKKAIRNVVEANRATVRKRWHRWSNAHKNDTDQRSSEVAQNVDEGRRDQRSRDDVGIGHQRSSDDTTNAHPDERPPSHRTEPSLTGHTRGTSGSPTTDRTREDDQRSSETARRGRALAQVSIDRSREQVPA